MSFSLPGRSLVSQADRSIVPRNDVPRSSFKQTWNHKTTADAGLLYPFCVIEVLPGDFIRLSATPFVRTATPLFPIMDNQRIDTHFFYVPLRLLWSNFQKFMGEQVSPGDSIAFTIPQLTSTGNGFAVGSLGDHFGLPTVGQAAAVLSVSALPFRAYNAIFNAWFRDENLVVAAATALGDSTTVEGSYPVLRRAKSHDYFTSCLLAPQKFTAPIVQSPVIGLGVDNVNVAQPSVLVKETPSLAFPTGVRSYLQGYSASGADIWNIEALADGTPQVFAQASISVLRQAFLIQQYLEKDSRGGTRYIERNLNHFGVRSPDARLDRPEFIGGGQTPLVFTPVAQTAGTPLGLLGAAGTAVGRHQASYASTEDGLIIGLFSVKSQLSYSQGLARMWSRLVRTDYYVPSLALLSEQAVLRKELYMTGVALDDNTVFGYQEAFQELRQRCSEVTGLFRPRSAGNIAQWHLSQNFATPPVLGATFIGDSPDMARVFAGGVTVNGQQYLFDIDISMESVRPVPVYGVPAQLGRF